MSCLWCRRIRWDNVLLSLLQGTAAVPAVTKVIVEGFQKVRQGIEVSAKPYTGGTEIKGAKDDSQRNAPSGQSGAHLPKFSQQGADNTHLLRKDLRALRQLVFIIFDGYEAVAENKPVADWLCQQLLNEIETALGLAVIVAGQRVPDPMSSFWRELARHVQVGPITNWNTGSRGSSGATQPSATRVCTFPPC